MPNRHNSISSEPLVSQPWKKADAIQRDFSETAMWTIQAPEVVAWLTEVEEFFGWKFVAIIQHLEGEARDKYITLVTTRDTLRPLLSRLIARSQRSERVSVSRVIAYIQANI